jgi:hypothetical protein
VFPAKCPPIPSKSYKSAMIHSMGQFVYDIKLLIKAEVPKYSLSVLNVITFHIQSDVKFELFAFMQILMLPQ